LRPGRWAIANAVVYIALAALVGTHAGALCWAARALPLTLVGRFPPLRERELARRAQQLLDAGAEPERVRAVLDEATRIDPLSFLPLEAEVERRAGHPERATQLYRRALEVDPSQLVAYLQLAALLEAQGQPEQAAALLRGGIAWFGREIELQRPRPDPSVAQAFNERAERVQAQYLQSIRALRGELERLSQGAAVDAPRG
jgi:predicted Zn-dependent protease